MSGKLVVDTISPDNTENNVTIDSNVTINGEVTANNVFGAIKPFITEWKQTISSFQTFNVDLGLGSTQAKYLLANVYVHCDHSAGNNDYISHFFGSRIQGLTRSNIESTEYYNLIEESDNNYVTVSFHGGVGSPYPYGIYNFLIIPLKDDTTFDAHLGYNYNEGPQYIKLRTIGYIE